MNYLDEVKEIVDKLDRESIQEVIRCLQRLREKKGRLFILGVGGSAANASHAVNDFRKLCGIEAYAPTDNVAELTARANDDGWDSVFVNWLRVSDLSFLDAVLVLSVGGGNLEKNVSPNLVKALEYAKERGAGILGIVGRDGGYTKQVADACVVIPTVNPDHVTPHTESFQAIIWHMIVWIMKIQEGKWESLK